ncbi:MAG: hypothetical protein WD795_06595 [Woeseia sp.]
MMYVRFPELTESEELAGLAPLNLAHCCNNEKLAGAFTRPIESFQIEMAAGEPVIRINSHAVDSSTISLSSGRQLAGVDMGFARKHAAGFLRESGIGGGIVAADLIRQDQWTVSGAFERDRPLYRFRAGDPESTEVYVSSSTGAVVQNSTGRERFWNWFGAVAHWLYPTVLRQFRAAWYHSVVWTSVASLCLIVIGIYIGLRQHRLRRKRGRSPYRGAALWHHYGGLMFGALALTWVASGLVSMNPWGFLASDGSAAESLLPIPQIAPADVSLLIAGLRNPRLAADTVRLESAVFGGELALIAHRSNGARTRLHPASHASMPLSFSELQATVEGLLAEQQASAALELLDSEDRYYFGHHEKAVLPVYRVVADDPERTRYYLDPDTGQLISKVDGKRRWYRWLFEALHRGDFSPFVRQRPLWDVLLLTALAGVTILSVTGTYMGARRLFGRRRH